MILPTGGVGGKKSTLQDHCRVESTLLWNGAAFCVLLDILWAQGEEKKTRKVSFADSVICCLYQTWPLMRREGMHFLRMLQLAACGMKWQGLFVWMSFMRAAYNGGGAGGAVRTQSCENGSYALQEAHGMGSSAPQHSPSVLTSCMLSIHYFSLLKYSI